MVNAAVIEFEHGKSCQIIHLVHDPYCMTSRKNVEKEGQGTYEHVQTQALKKSL